jgi:hypothetical protein
VRSENLTEWDSPLKLDYSVYSPTVRYDEVNNNYEVESTWAHAYTGCIIILY